MNQAMAIAALLLASTRAWAVSSVPLPDEPKLIGKQVPIVDFEDDAGRQRSLSSLAGQPLIVLPVYTRCHSSCSQIAANLKSAILRANLDIRKFQVFLFSFDTEDTIDDLRAFRSKLALPLAWTLGRMDGKSIEALTESLDYRRAREGGEWLHPNAVAFLTPDLKLASMIYGTSFAPGQISNGLKASQSGGSWAHRFAPQLFAIAVMGLIFSAVWLAHKLSRRA